MTGTPAHHVAAHDLKRIKEDYDREKALFGPSKRKELLTQLAKTKKAAETLREHLGALPKDQFCDLDDDGNPDLEFSLVLRDTLDALIHRLDMYEAPAAKNTRGRAEDRLVKKLWSICPDPKCYYSEHEKRFTGSFVDFLEETLPKLGIRPIKTQAFARRYQKLKYQT